MGNYVQGSHPSASSSSVPNRQRPASAGASPALATSSARPRPASARPASARTSRLESVPEPQSLEVEGLMMRPQPPNGRPSRPSSARPSSARLSKEGAAPEPVGAPLRNAPAREATSLGPTQVNFAWPTPTQQTQYPGAPPVYASIAPDTQPVPQPSAPRRRPTSAGPVKKRPSSAASATTLRSARPGSQFTGRWSTQSRPSSARPASARRRSAKTGESNAASVAPAAPPKKVVYSQQLISRYCAESEVRPRLVSTLARQLERYRDMLPAYAEQQRVVQTLRLRSERERQSLAGELGRLMAEREVMVKDCERKADCLAQGLAHEKEKASQSADKVKLELAKSIALEQETTSVLTDEEVKNKALRATLDQTMEQLNTLRTEVLQYQAEAEEVKQGRTMNCGEQAPELMQALRRMDGIQSERQQVSNEMTVARAELLRIQDELNDQRGHSQRLEDFVRRISTGGRYVLDPMRKKEAASILHAAAQLRPHASGAGAARAAVARADAESAVEKDGQPARLTPPTVEEVQGIAAQIMEAADGIVRNGQLSISELQAFLGEGTVGGHQFGHFMNWLLASGSRRFYHWDSDHDGSISLEELEGAVKAYLDEAVSASAWKAHGRVAARRSVPCAASFQLDRDRRQQHRRWTTTPAAS